MIPIKDKYNTRRVEINGQKKFSLRLFLGIRE